MGYFVIAVRIVKIKQRLLLSSLKSLKYRTGSYYVRVRFNRSSKVNLKKSIF